MSQFFTHHRRVEFAETDAAGIAHFSAFFLYMEQTEHAMWRHLGLSVFPMLTSVGEVSWPRVAASCQYRGPVRFEQTLEIHLQIARLGDKSITFQYEMFLNANKVADGETTTVCCRMSEGHKIESVRIPDEVRAKLTPYVRA
ncbi:MAG: acyl-CoA thioesterase [Planctomycetaceae bacterium]|nr:acyl-CoA thioesterase [Planctomycetaceae bacterium]